MNRWPSMPPPRLPCGGTDRARRRRPNDGDGGRACTWPAIDPVVTAVIANRIDGIVREMTNTLLRAARSAVISSARDFSCGICTADNQLLACVEGLPIHIFGVHEQALGGDGSASGPRPRVTRSCTTTPVTGNTHPADHAVPCVPVPSSTASISSPPSPRRTKPISATRSCSTYHAGAKDVYEEGAADLPGGAHPARLPDDRRRRAHGAQPHPRRRPVVRRLPRRTSAPPASASAASRNCAPSSARQRSSASSPTGWTYSSSA